MKRTELFNGKVCITVSTVDLGGIYETLAVDDCWYDHDSDRTIHEGKAIQQHDEMVEKFKKMGFHTI